MSGSQHTAYLQYAWYDTAWHTATVDTRSFTGWESSLALDAAGNPHISYMENNANTNYFLDYAWYDTSWHTTTVDSSGKAGEGPSIALDAAGNPHISYSAWGATDGLKYAWYDTTWHTQTVDSNAYEYAQTSLALDAAGNPHISYGGNGLKMAVSHAPIANAGLDQIVKTKSTVTLDGSQSTDPDGDSLTYVWTLMSKPSKSNSLLMGDTTATPTFKPDKAGTYTVQLVVTGGGQQSTDTVTVTATNKPSK